MITVHIVVRTADEASRWYSAVFGAVERSRIELPDGKLIHVEMDLDGTTLMLADEFPNDDAYSPQTTGSTSAVFYFHTDDADRVFARAIDAGATVLRELDDVFWGEREGQVIDPFGHRWGITQHLRSVSPEEMTQIAGRVFATSNGPAEER